MSEADSALLSDLSSLGFGINTKAMAHLMALIEEAVVMSVTVSFGGLKKR